MTQAIIEGAVPTAQKSASRTLLLWNKSNLPSALARKRAVGNKSCKPGRWLCAAIGDEGDMFYWKDDYTALEEVRSLFCQLESYGPEAIPLDELVAGLPVFAHPSGNPPLYNEYDFDDVEGMRASKALGWREDRWVGLSAA